MHIDSGSTVSSLDGVLFIKSNPIRINLKLYRGEVNEVAWYLHLHKPIIRISGYQPNNELVITRAGLVTDFMVEYIIDC